MEEILCSSKEAPWATTKKGISINDFTVVARIWLYIIYNQVSPCIHMSSIPVKNKMMLEVVEMMYRSRARKVLRVVTGRTLYYFLMIS